MSTGLKLVIVAVLLIGIASSVGAAPKQTSHSESLSATLAKINQEEKKKEARLNARIPLRKRRKIYYAVTKAYLDAALHPAIWKNFKASAAINIYAVCTKFHITADDADIIRTEGDRAGWPEATN